MFELAKAEAQFFNPDLATQKKKPAEKRPSRSPPPPPPPSKPKPDQRKNSAGNLSLAELSLGETTGVDGYSAIDGYSDV
jgi:hypothetical protein